MTGIDDITRTVHEYGDMLYRICILSLKNFADAEDVVQDTFITYMMKSPDFSSEAHKKNWLITVSVNKCKDMLRRRCRQADQSEQIIESIAVEEDCSGVLDALLELPEKFRLVMSLHYVEGYKVEEISRIIGRSTSAVKMRLQKGRKLLKDIYEKEEML